VNLAKTHRIPQQNAKSPDKFATPLQICRDARSHADTIVLMPADLDRPAGYCPNCEYPINPGVCPECGQDVPADHLSKFPPRQRRRRNRRRAILAATLLIAIVGGHQAYHRVDWISIIPARYLLKRCTHQTADRYTQELLRRHIAGTLAKEESSQLFSVLFPVELILRSEYPTAYEIKPRLRAERQSWPGTIPFPTLSFVASESEIKIDGAMITSARLDKTDSSSMSATGRVRDFPFLDPGTHDVEFLGRVGVFMPGAPAPAVFPYQFKKTIRIEDHPWSTFVRPVWSEEWAESVRAALTAVAVDDPTSPGNYQIVVTSTGLMVPVTGLIEFRIDGHFAGITSTFSSLPLLSWQTRSHRYSFGWQKLPPGATKADVIITPSAGAALDQGLDEYFGGQIRWTGLSILKDANFNLASFPLGSQATGINQHALYEED